MAPAYANLPPPPASVPALPPPARFFGSYAESDLKTKPPRSLWRHLHDMLTSNAVVSCGLLSERRQVGYGNRNSNKSGKSATPGSSSWTPGESRPTSGPSTVTPGSAGPAPVSSVEAEPIVIDDDDLKWDGRTYDQAFPALSKSENETNTQGSNFPGTSYAAKVSLSETLPAFETICSNQMLGPQETSRAPFVSTSRSSYRGWACSEGRRTGASEMETPSKSSKIARIAQEFCSSSESGGQAASETFPDSTTNDAPVHSTTFQYDFSILQSMLERPSERESLLVMVQELVERENGSQEENDI